MKIDKHWERLRLTENFRLGECVISSTRPDLEIKPTEEQAEYLYLMCVFLLQPVRDRFGPTRITSGLRSTELNKLVGGVPTSQHVTGKGVDFKCTEKMHIVYEWIIDELNWRGELILYQKHIHCGFPEYDLGVMRKIIT